MKKKLMVIVYRFKKMQTIHIIFLSIIIIHVTRKGEGKRKIIQSKLQELLTRLLIFVFRVSVIFFCIYQCNISFLKNGPDANFFNIYIKTVRHFQVKNIVKYLTNLS